MLRGLIDFVLPPVCVVCGDLDDSRPARCLCERCMDALPWLSAPVCDRCGAPMGTDSCAPSSALAGGVSRCRSCAGRRVPFRRARASLAYRQDVREVIHGLKYEGVRLPAAALARRSATVWPAPFFDVDAVTFVPLTERSLARRGYNQAELLARELAAVLRLEVAPWLAKRSATDDQVALDRSARRANVSRAYASRAGTPPAGRRILLVDDVYTTGATGETCAGLLRRAGWREVHLWTLARVVRGVPSRPGDRPSPAAPHASHQGDRLEMSLRAPFTGRSPPPI
jgi:ComF family protein